MCSSLFEAMCTIKLILESKSLEFKLLSRNKNAFRFLSESGLIDLYDLHED